MSETALSGTPGRHEPALVEPGIRRKLPLLLALLVIPVLTTLVFVVLLVILAAIYGSQDVPSHLLSWIWLLCLLGGIAAVIRITRRRRRRLRAAVALAFGTLIMSWIFVIVAGFVLLALYPPNLPVFCC
jgi:uncharacterized membrane protein